MKIKALLIFSALALLPGLALQAATRTWTGGGADTNWTTAGNWSGTAPVAGDSLVFASNSPAVNNFTAGTAFAGISLTGATNYILSGNAIQLTGDVSRDGSQSAIFSFDIELTGTSRTFNVDGPAVRTLEINSVISGTSGIEKTGDGMLRLRDKNNTFSGGITVTAGTLAARGVGATTHFGTGKLTVNGGIVSLSAADTTITDLGGTGGVIENGQASIVRTLTVNSTNVGGSSYSGVIQNGGAGAMSLSKSGVGLLTLTGTNTYTGATSVSNGTLLISSGGTLGNTAVTVGTAGTFGGNGGSVAGTVQVDSGGDMAFTLTNTAQTNLTLASTLNLAGSNDLKLTLNVAAAPSDAFTLIANTGARTGTFATVNGAAFGIGNTFTLSFGGDDYNFELVYGSNSIVAQVVPEPSVSILAGLALGATLIFRRRNRH